MTDGDKALAERLLALHVWPQSIADGYAELLTPRQVDKLYEVGPVSREAAARIKALSAENERLREENARLHNWLNLKYQKIIYGPASLGDAK